MYMYTYTHPMVKTGGQGIHGLARGGKILAKEPGGG